MKSSTISFKPLQEDNLELLCKWLDKPLAAMKNLVLSL